MPWWILILGALLVGKPAVIENQEHGFEACGAVLQLWNSTEPEIMISGPAETGKTFGALHKLHAMACKWPKYQGIIIRKTLTSCYSSVIQTWENKVIPEAIRTEVVKPYGGKKAEFYEYWNGSRIFVGGMDNPDRVLSSERDGMLVNQAEELVVDDWEALTSRVTGRAGNAPFPQLIGDCNPGPRNHWILNRAKAGSMVMLNSIHKDNPALYNARTGEWTEQGKRTLAILNKLTGTRRTRLLEGKWVSAEGIVYEIFDPATHVINRFDIPADWYRYLGIDWGFTNPMCVQWWAVDGDGRAYRYREIYVTQALVEDVAKRVKELSAGERIQYAITDHDPEKRANFERYSGIDTIKANKARSAGIDAVSARLRPAADGKPRILFLRDSLVDPDPLLEEESLPKCTEDEFEVYVWPKDMDGKPRKEDPVDVNNHGMDAMRYFVMELETLQDENKIRVT